MAKLHEVIDSLNDENVSEVKELLKAEANALDNSNKQLYARAKKAEGFEQKDGKWIKAEKSAPPEPPTPEAKQPNEPDYAKEAFLEQRGISHADDKKLVYDEAQRLKLPLTDVLGMDHIKSKLSAIKTQREAEAGMPSGSGKAGSGSKNSVEYYVDKKDKDGNYVTPDDLELANKVIDARVKQQTSQSMFSPDLHN